MSGVSLPDLMGVGISLVPAAFQADELARR